MAELENGAGHRLKEPGRWPLSRGQQSLWITTQLAPESGAYNMSLAYEIFGELDAGRLEAALVTIVRRHHVLSSLVDDSGETLCQVTVDSPEIRLRLATLDAPTANPMSAVAAFASEPFDLRRQLPVRPALFQLGPDHHIFALCVHHLVADGWSLDLIIEELGSAYAGTLSSDPDRVPQFAEFAAAEDGAEARERLAFGRDYWLEQLEGAAQVLELPAERPRPPVKDYSGRMFVRSLPSSVVDRLRRYCGATRHTPSSVLLACYAALLHRDTGRADFLLGVPMPARMAEGSENCVGLFANLIPLRVRASPELSFQGLLNQTWLDTIAAMDWQDYPFVSTIRDLKPVRCQSRTPVVQIVFNYIRPRTSLHIEGAEVRQADIKTIYSKYDFELHIIDGRDQLKWMLVYDAAIFDDAFVKAFYRDFLDLLESAISSPELSLNDLFTLTALE